MKEVKGRVAAWGHAEGNARLRWVLRGRGKANHIRRQRRLREPAVSATLYRRALPPPCSADSSHWTLATTGELPSPTETATRLLLIFYILAPAVVEGWDVHVAHTAIPAVFYNRRQYECKAAILHRTSIAAKRGGGGIRSTHHVCTQPMLFTMFLQHTLIIINADIWNIYKVK